MHFYISDGQFIYRQVVRILLAPPRRMRRGIGLAGARARVLGSVTLNVAAGRVTRGHFSDFRAIGARQGGVFEGLNIGGIRRTAGCTLHTKLMSSTRCCV